MLCVLPVSFSKREATNAMKSNRFGKPRAGVLVIQVALSNTMHHLLAPYELKKKPNKISLLNFISIENILLDIVQMQQNARKSKIDTDAVWCVAYAFDAIKHLCITYAISRCYCHSLFEYPFDFDLLLSECVRFKCALHVEQQQQ